MTHRQECIATCMDYLNQLSLAAIFSMAVFNKYYDSINAKFKNAYSVGIAAADSMINSFNNLKTQEV